MKNNCVRRKTVSRVITTAIIISLLATVTACSRGSVTYNESKVWSGESFEFSPLKDTSRLVILDTDIGPDCDDVGAIKLMYELQKKYGFTVAGVVNCTSNKYGCGAVAGLADYMGQELPLLGEYEEKGLLANHRRYNKFLTKHFAPKYTAMPAKELYKQVLTDAPDDGVIVIAIGQYTTLANAISEYRDLFAKKVNCVVTMGANFNDGSREFNVYCHVESAKYVFENCPVPIIATGYEVGESIETGYDSVPRDADKNPVYIAYKKFCVSSKPRRKSWNLTAVQYAIEGNNGFYKLSERYSIKVKNNGSTENTPCSTGNVQYLIKTASDQAITDYLDSICFN